ncbi:FecR family protein [Pedobacter cryoconitis]|uniref:Ferric-dicitrate binding protein FerR (Iron transport regulator) n=1 Tax=Pedobacter cryoconitis TaxID=188932 RepID=A0A7X0J6R1_9SPHI|nr:FecR domain-containing protein [Pedobacter cryoconitis]MBB6501337.1 ferric-dicitrate binding protein FerR (iron transport regulator) [Pedobacter cryoconitis]
MEDKDELKELYQLYLSNQCSATELERFFELLRETKDDSAITALMSATWDNTEAVPESGLIPSFLVKEPAPVIRRIGYRFRQFSAAAAILLVLGGAYLFREKVSQVFNPVHQLEVFSKNAEHKQIQLADGTRVWLSPNSKLSFPDKFDKSKRIVNLDGEAFFEVVHDVHHPFIIQSGDVSTTVLGTSFNVNAYRNRPDIEVTLVTGKVAVALKTANKDQQAIISPNQRVTVNKAAEKITKMNYPAASDFLNRRLGLFDYKGTDFSEVLTDLQTQYHQKIQLAPSLEPGKFYGQLDMTLPIEQCLNKLSTVMEVNWKKEGGLYVIVK